MHKYTAARVPLLRRKLPPCVAYPFSWTCLCNLIEDLASVANAELANQQPTHKRLIRRSKGVTPRSGRLTSLRPWMLYASTDVVFAARHPRQGSVRLRRLGVSTRSRWCTFAKPCARRDSPDAGTKHACTVLTEVFELQIKDGLFLSA